MSRAKSNSRRKSMIGIRCVGLVIVVLWVVAIAFWGTIKPPKSQDNNGNDFLGKFGAMMVEMLPEGVPFTLFMPSERAFKRHLGLSSNATTLTDDAYAIVSRVLGFSAIPRALGSADVAVDRLSSYDSVSGFALYVSKDRHGMLVVNGVRSDRVDLQTRQIVVHVMDGVIMDSQFQESF